MNLQEQTNRIKQMMGIINEDNSTKLIRYQKLVNMIVDDLKHKCETENSDDDEIVLFEACDLIDSDLKVRVVDIKKYDTNKSILILIEYKNYSYHIDESSFVYELRKGLKEWLGDIKIEVEDSVNTFPNEDRQW